jgi:ribose/xylose/arabinose/galactoside ABC-type transport system permease subunit
MGTIAGYAHPDRRNSVNLNRDFGVLAIGNMLGIPRPDVVHPYVALLAHFYSELLLGRYSGAIGSNPEAARCSGIPMEVHTRDLWLGRRLTGWPDD